FFFSSRRRHTRFSRDWSSDVCSSDLVVGADAGHAVAVAQAVFHQGLDEPDGVAKVPRVMHAQQNPVPWGQVHEEAETVLALQVRSEERRVGKGRNTE